MGMRGKNKTGWFMSVEDSYVKMHTQCDHEMKNCVTTGEVKPQGLGDTIANGLEKLGVKKKKGCGCKERQEKLNKLIPYNKD